MDRGLQSYAAVHKRVAGLQFACYALLSEKSFMHELLMLIMMIQLRSKELQSAIILHCSERKSPPAMKALLFLLSAILSWQAECWVLTSAPVSRSSVTGTSTSLNFGPFGQPKDDGSPGDYICKVRFNDINFCTGI